MRRWAPWVLVLALSMAGCAQHKELTFGQIIQKSSPNSFEDGLRTVDRTKSGLVSGFNGQPSFADPDGDLGVLEVTAPNGSTQVKFGLVEGAPIASSTSQYVAFLQRPNGAPRAGPLRVNIIDVNSGEVVAEHEVAEGSTLGGVYRDEVLINEADGSVWRWTPQGNGRLTDTPAGSALVGVTESRYVWITNDGVLVTDRDFAVIRLSEGDVWGALDVTEDHLLSQDAEGSWWVYTFSTEDDGRVFAGAHEETVVASWLPSGRLLGQTQGKAASCKWNGFQCYATDPLTAGEEFGPADTVPFP